MVKEIFRSIEIPKDVDVSVEDTLINVKGPKGHLSKVHSYPGIEIKKENSQILVKTKSDRIQQTAMVGTIASHINNMLKGVTEGFEYKMKAVYSHFPIQLKATSNAVSISNFLGERQSRSARILPGTKVVVQKDEIIITGIDKESVGQTMANIEQATRVKKFDVRVFQDGVYLVDKR